MIKLNKKIITYIIFSFIFAVAIIFIGNSKTHIIPVSSIPVSEYTIVLDAGHGQPDRAVL